MDSLTQIVLGAAVGEAFMGKKVGNRAPLWGAIGGTIPDLDFVTSIFQGDFDYLVSHRGFTHSITFCLLFAPLMGVIIQKIYKGKWGTRNEWAKLSFWAFFTHTLLDCCTSWGTQLFYPFSDYRVALNNIFVADPLYTVPFLLCVLAVLFINRESKWRRIINLTGIIISSSYLLLTFINKATVNMVFEQALHNKGKSTLRYSTYPTPLNNVLWYVVAEGPYEYNIGLYSLLSKERNVTFTSIPKNHQPVKGMEDNYVIDRLKWVSKGYYTVEEKEDQLIWHDLRFGLMNAWSDKDEAPQFIFTFTLVEEDGEIIDIASDGPPGPESFGEEELNGFWNQIMGESPK